MVREGHCCAARQQDSMCSAVRQPTCALAAVASAAWLVTCQLPQINNDVHLQVALAFAFYIEGFLMENHRKHEPLDQTVHTLLVCCPP